MGGLEKILEQIDAQAQAQAQARLQAANADAEAYRRQAQMDCQAQIVQLREKSTRDIAACQTRAAAAVAQQRRMALLQTKQMLIAQVLQNALHALQEKPAAEYFEIIQKLVRCFARPQAGCIVFSQNDLARMPQNFAETIQAIAREKGGDLTFTPAGDITGGGFILVYGGIEENCTFPALFAAKKGELQDLVHQQLFA